MQLIRSRIFIGFLSLNFFVTAQVVNERDNELDKKYTPPQNSIFNNLNVKNNQSSSGREVEIKNAIKFCPTLLLRQKVAFFYAVLLLFIPLLKLFIYVKSRGCKT